MANTEAADHGGMHVVACFVPIAVARALWMTVLTYGVEEAHEPRLLVWA